MSGNRGRLLRELGASVALLALGLEIAARIAFGSAPLSEALLLAPSDVAWSSHWKNQHRRGAGIALPFDVYDPSRGWALRANLHDLSAFGGKTLSSNSRGVRGPREYEYERREGSTRILALGDSYTFGEEVGDDETYSHLLQELVPHSEVINLGVHGYAHDQMLVYLEEEGLKYRPDVVILGYVTYDMRRNLLGFRDYAKPRYELVDGRLELNNVPVPAPESLIQAGLWGPRVVDLLRTFYLGTRYWLGFSGVEKLTEAILGEIAAEARSISAQPLFVYLPVVSEFRDESETLTDDEKLFVRFARKAGADYLLLRPRFLESVRRGARLQTDLLAHWGPEEHRIAAVAISEHLAAPPRRPE